MLCQIYNYEDKRYHIKDYILNNFTSDEIKKYYSNAIQNKSIMYFIEKEKIIKEIAF